MINMDKLNLQTLKGFRDFLPEDVKKRNYLKKKLIEMFELFGFEPLETPVLEYEEILLNKAGGEADKLLFSFEDLGGRKIALRYDQTVPTARVLAMNYHNLPMPWRRYQIQHAYRAEKPQSGRFREFLHCDADIYGSSSPVADAEIISLVYKIYKSLGFEKFTIYINDRNILFSIIEKVDIDSNLQLPVITAIDKLDRKSEDEVTKDLVELGVTKEQADHLFELLNNEKPTQFLNEVINTSTRLGVAPGILKFEARLARGLDYYTSTIFEVKVTDYKFGSVLGGGRYDNLIKKLSGYNIPAVGFGLGFDRTLEAMEQLKLIPNLGKRKGVLVSVFNQYLADATMEVAQNLRENGITTEIYPNEVVKLDKQLKYADKKFIKWFIVIGPNEVENDRIILKNLETGHQEDVKLSDLVNKIAGSKK